MFFPARKGRPESPGRAAAKTSKLILQYTNSINDNSINNDSINDKHINDHSINTESE